jgi:hypothetical protein
VPDVLLTGLPRSGTTLSCELLNRVPGTVALDEPMGRRHLREHGEAFEDAVARFLADTRTSIAERGVAPSRLVDGRVSGGKIAERDASGERRKLATRGEMEVGRLEGDFTLVVKHNSSFTARLGPLSRRFRVCAIVRHPLAVLGSWQGVPLNVRDGHVPAGERHDPRLAEALAAIDDVLERQLHVLRWFFDRFVTHLPREAIVRYEDVVASGGAALAAVAPAAAALAEPLATRNLSGRYGEEALARLVPHLADPAAPWWRLYSPASVDELLAR